MKYLMRLYLALFLLFVLGCSTTQVSSTAPTEPDLAYIATAPLDAELPVDPNLRTAELDNGLRYYVRGNERPRNRAELRLLVNVGSLQEDDDQQGLAHFIEHMAFNGTRNFEKHELTDYLESIGMRFGADLNASTSFDQTIYQLTVPTDDPEILAQAFQILEDWAHGLSLEEEEIDKERGVVLEEWRLGRGAGARQRDEQFPILFKGSRYAERLPIGLPEILENAPYDAFRRFYRDWYRPDLMAVVAVGDFDPELIETLIRKHFSRLESVAEPRTREVYDVPDHAETLWSSWSDPEITQTSVEVYYKLPRQGTGTYGDYRRSLVEGAYNLMLGTRLQEIAQQPDPPFFAGYSGASSLVRSRAVYNQGATVADGGVLRGLEAIVVEAERVERHGFTSSELQRAQTLYLRSYEQAYRERDKAHSSSLASECGRNFFTEESIPGMPVELALAKRFMPSIQLDEVNQLGRDWITEENRVVLLSGPEKEGAELPTQEEVLGIFAEVAGREIAPYVDKVLDEPLLAEIPTPGRVVEEKTVPVVGVTEWRLANGVRVVMKPTDFRNDQLLLSGWSPGGTSLVADEDYVSANLSTMLLGESGLGNFGSIELGKALVGKVANVRPFLGELEEGISGAASPEDLETMLQLLYLHFTAPRLEDDAVRSVLSRLEIALENRLSAPGTVFRDQLTKTLSQDHVRRRPFSNELLAEVDPKKSLEIFRERFADASDFTFILVGNFTPEKIRPLIETYLGGLPSQGRVETWRDIGVHKPEGKIRFSVERGLEPKSKVRLIFSGPAEWSREESHLLRSLASGLVIRLREVLREDMGATYGVGVSGAISLRPHQEYAVSVGFGCAPDETEALIETLFAELEKVKAEGLDASYIEKVQESQRRGREVSLRENNFWMQVLQSYYTFDWELGKIHDYDQLVDLITPESLQKVAARYLNTERYVLAVLHPEAEAAEPTVDAEAGQ
jgi:zinc protease